LIPLRDTIPSRHLPFMMWALITANVVVFIMELSLSEPARETFFYLFGIVPARYSHPAWAQRVGFPAADYWPFLTSMFLHGGWTHILGNMWTLGIFGDNVEDRMGPWRFLSFYLACGLVAGGVHWLTNPNSFIPAVGASGAIAGVLGAYFRMFPRAQILTVFPVFFYPFFFTLPAAIYLLIWFFLQFLSGAAALAGPEDVSGVAWWAHIGGFVGGLLLHPLFLRPKD